MTRYHADLTNYELQQQVRRQGLPLHEQERIVTDAQIARRQRASERLFAKIHRDAWRAVLTPLRQEYSNALVSAAYDPTNEQRVEAFREYAEVLEHTRLRLIGRMNTLREIPLTFNEYVGNQTGLGEVLVWNDDKTEVVDRHLSPKHLTNLRSAYETDAPVKRRPFTPSELAKYMTERYEATGKGFPVPNNGVHWVDWISPAHRLRIDGLFSELAATPRKKGARLKEPFKRVDPADKWDAKRERLLETATKELERLTRLHTAAMQGHTHRMQAFAEMGVTPKEDPKALHLRLAKRKEKAALAVAKLRHWTRDDGALPNTWHGVLKME